MQKYKMHNDDLTKRIRQESWITSKRKLQEKEQNTALIYV